MNTRKPMIGEIVLFTPNPDDSVAKSNHNSEPIPAIVTRVWSEVCVNIKIVPDNGPMQDRNSVTHQSANPAGYHFEFQDEHYNPELKLRHIPVSVGPDGLSSPRRNRVDLFTPAEKAIYDAVQEVEKAGADVRLTHAVIKLSEARDLVADFVDGVNPIN